jgi:hypothetical protein
LGEGGSVPEAFGVRRARLIEHRPALVEDLGVPVGVQVGGPCLAPGCLESYCVSS